MITINSVIPSDFYRPENRKGYFVDEKKKKIWAVLLDMLIQLDDICTKHNLTYYVDAGTLLGAVREHGFIPWDDDIDVVMMRKDYNILVHECANEFTPPVFLQSSYTENGYLRTHSQIRNRNTTAILYNEKNIAKFNQGIFLDVFPLDYDSEDEKENARRFKKIDLYQKAFIKEMFGYDDINFWEGLEERLYTRGILLFGQEYAFRKFERICTSLYGGYVDKVVYYNDLSKYHKLQVEWFGTPKYLDFEFIKVPVPSCFNEILSEYYGSDYMIPNTSNSDHQIGGDVIFDPDTSYDKYITDII